MKSEQWIAFLSRFVPGGKEIPETGKTIPERPSDHCDISIARNRNAFAATERRENPEILRAARAE